jgi:basic amino acid/polyamine antiporter, APA family
MDTNPVFLRSVSGLVKTAGPWDLFAFNLGLISVGIALTLMHYYVPSNYQGASIPIAELIGGLLMACIAFGFWAWTVTIPRSGGLYAFVSRGLSPMAGFTFSFVDSLTWLFYNALAASYVTVIGLAPALFVIGFLTGNVELSKFALLLAQPLGQFVVGCAVIGFSTIVIIIGMRPFFRVQTIMLWIAIIGTVVTAATLFSASPGDVQSSFVKAFQAYVPKVADLAAAAPNTGQPFSWNATFFALVWPLLSFVGSIFSVNIGGEVRQASRSQAIGIFGSIAAALVLLMTLSVLGDRAFGPAFQSAVTAMQLETSEFPIPPYFSFLAALATQSPWLAGAICAAFLAWAFLWIPATLIYSARALLAWSFDRVAPAWLGEVHPRFHTPVNALLVVAFLNVIFLGLYLFSSFFNTLVLVLAAMIAWVPTMLAAIVFPYWRPQLYRGTLLSGHRIFGLPFLSAAGAIGLVAALIIVVMLWNDPVAAGHDWKTLSVVIGMFAAGAIWYFVAKSIRRREGLSIERAYQEIPID